MYARDLSERKQTAVLGRAGEKKKDTKKRKKPSSFSADPTRKERERAGLSRPGQAMPAFYVGPWDSAAVAPVCIRVSPSNSEADRQRPSQKPPSPPRQQPPAHGENTHRVHAPWPRRDTQREKRFSRPALDTEQQK